MQTFLKHSYIKTREDGLARAGAHVRYLAHRPGRDKGATADRTFFDARVDSISRRDVLDVLKNETRNDVVAIHKLILSPGEQGVDMKRYTRSVMAKLGSEKGLDLKWYAVSHNNTDHEHVHIVVLGQDAFGRRVKFDKRDHQKIKVNADAYLERTKGLRKEYRIREPKVRFDWTWKSFQKLFSSFANKFKKGASEQASNKRTISESAALGLVPSYREIEAKRALRLEKRDERAWRRYVRPIVINEVDELGATQSNNYHRRSPLAHLRKLEKRYFLNYGHIIGQMSQNDLQRLQRWIKESWKENKQLETSAKSVSEIKVKLSEEEEINVKRGSEKALLKRLRLLHETGKVNLDEKEYKALKDWLKPGFNKLE